MSYPPPEPEEKFEVVYSQKWGQMDIKDQIAYLSAYEARLNKFYNATWNFSRKKEIAVPQKLKLVIEIAWAQERIRTLRSLAKAIKTIIA